MNISKTRKLTTISMLCALAYIAVFVGRIPIVLFLKYDPKDVIIVIGGLIYGPLTALAITVAVSVVQNDHGQRDRDFRVYDEYYFELFLCVYRCTDLSEETETVRRHAWTDRRMRLSGCHDDVLELSDRPDLHGVSKGSDR